MTRSRNHFCRRKAISVRYSDCVYLALIVQHAVLMGLLHCHLWRVWLTYIVAHYLTNVTILGKRLLKIKYVFLICH
jgi:hypothetical protein